MLRNHILSLPLCFIGHTCRLWFSVERDYIGPEYHRYRLLVITLEADYHILKRNSNIFLFTQNKEAVYCVQKSMEMLR